MDQRNCKRVSVRYPVTWVDMEGNSCQVQSCDLSPVGIGILRESTADIGKPIEVALQIPIDNEIVEIIARCKVKSLTHLENGYRVGLHFVRFSGEGATALQELIDSMEGLGENDDEIW